MRGVDLDRLARKGPKALRAWIEDAGDVPDHRVEIAMHPGGASAEGQELRLDGEVVYRLVHVLGEGRNLVAYLTDQDTCLKVVKRPRNARKNLLAAWAAPKIQAAGIRIAPVLRVGPDGIFVEVEYVPGDSLEKRYGYLDRVPKRIRKLVLEDWERAKALRDEGIWLDLKSANYHERDGEVVLIDYAPRTNSTYYRYFRTDEKKELSPERFLDLFFHHDLRKRDRR